jgi:NifU-like protein
MHCSVMGREALQAAVANYRGEEWKDDHEEGALICKCFAVDAVLIEDTIRANGLTTVEEVTNYTKAGGGCSACHEGVEEILTRVLADQGKTFDPSASAPPPVGKAKLTNLQRIRRIENAIEAIRPNLQRDHGDIELVDIDGKNVYVNMTGACSGCQMASTTLDGVQQRIVEDLGEFVRVIPAPKGQAPRPGVPATTA